MLDPIRLNFGPSTASGIYHAYRIAGQNIASQQSVDVLRAFEVEPDLFDARLARPQVEAEPPSWPTRAADIAVSGWLGLAWRPIQCWHEQDRTLVQVDNQLLCSIGLSSGEVTVHSTGQNTPDSLLVETVLGPLLLLLLAERDIWGIHCGAVATESGVVMVMGESGSGKSTTSRYLAQEADLGSLAADDLLPTSADGEWPMAHPRYPQLKLPAVDQPGARLPEGVKIRAIYELERVDELSTPLLEALSKRQAALQLIRHSVATRLFRDRILAAHVTYCADLASNVSVKRLRFMHNRSHLEKLGKLIQSDLGRASKVA